MRDAEHGKRDAEGENADDTSGLEHIVSELRDDVGVRAAWRKDVLGEVEAMPRPARRAPGDKGWTISPPAAIAAALAFTALGAAGAVGVLSLRDDQGRVTSAERPEAVSQSAVRSRMHSVRFALVAPGASRVSLVGDFNQWDASATPMRQLGDGRLWLVEVPLPPGRHVYAFVVDGDVTPDPAAPRAGEEDFGVPSSVVLVGNRGS
ncbi:MAG: isoamylase early set domain-containing protein [Gemmatimonadaceae bacterium]